MTRAIECDDFVGATTDEFLECTVIAGIEVASSSEDFRLTSDELTSLPAELQAVAQLPAKLRQPFVLRMLMSMSREFSARLLDIDINAVDGPTGLAAQVLAHTALMQRG